MRKKEFVNCKEEEMLGERKVMWLVRVGVVLALTTAMGALVPASANGEAVIVAFDGATNQHVVFPASGGT